MATIGKDYPMKRSIYAVAGVLGLAAVTQAQAHVTLSQTTAPSGSSFIAFFRVTHGCAG